MNAVQFTQLFVENGNWPLKIGVEAAAIVKVNKFSDQMKLLLDV